MKKIVLSIILAIVVSITSFAQSPKAFKYQAVARDLTGNVLPNQAVSFRISILQTTTTGTSVYLETHVATTNSFGLVNLEIGNGTFVSGNFSTISWGADIYFVKIEMDETGGTSYQLMGTSQLLSVPYALHAKTVEIDNVNDADSSAINELQTLSITGNQVTISNGNTITLPNKIVRATINGGFAPTIVSGTGFTIVRSSTGTYIVTFSTPFATPPSATVSLFNTQFVDCGVVISSISTTNMVIKTGKGDGNTSYTDLDGLSFSFIVVE